MKPLPMPLRIAAGLVATALEEVQELPRKLTELPVTAVSQALQASMRLQQRVTELAIKGDRALGALRPVPETPTWARFDEDEELGSPRNGMTNGLRQDDLPRPPKVTPVRILPDLSDLSDLSDPVTPDISEVPAPRPPAEHPDTALLTQPTETDGASTTPSTRTSGKASTRSDPKARTKPSPKPTTRSDAKPSTKSDAKSTTRSDAKPSTKPTTRSDAEPSPKPSTKSDAKPTTRSDAKPRGRSASTPSTEPSSDVQLATPAAVEPATPEQPDPVAQPAASGPPGLAEYEQWSLPQLRGRFRAMSVEQLEQLLAWETSHQDRPPFVTMLSNRIASVTGR
jgi:hypothetical protein